MKSCLHLLVFVMVNAAAIALDQDENLLSKFFQNDYSVKLERATLVSYNKQLFKELSWNYYKYNRTTRALNVSMESLIDLTDPHFRILVETFKRYDNEYKDFNIRMSLPACKMIRNNIAGLSTSHCGNIRCPLLKNVRQRVCNWVPNYSRLPPFIPDGDYLIKFNFTQSEQYLYAVDILFTIYRNI